MVPQRNNGLSSMKSGFSRFPGPGKLPIPGSILIQQRVEQRHDSREH
jgi:hypothetical protein